MNASATMYLLHFHRICMHVQLELELLEILVITKCEALELGRSTARATENVVDATCKIINSSPSVPAIRQWSRCRPVPRRRTW